MASPRTYAEWVPLIDSFRNGDNNALGEMAGGTLEWTNVVAERWTKHLGDCLNERLHALSRDFQRSLDRAAGDHLAMGNAMLAVRRTLGILRQFCELKAAPAEVRQFLRSNVEAWATQTQQSLERSALLVRHDQGRLLKTIRDHALTVRTPVSAPTVVPPEPQASPTRGRRVMF